MLNRRGHAPTVLLFVEGLVLMLITWFTFIGMSNDLNGQNEVFFNLDSKFHMEKYYVEALVPRLIDKSLNELTSYDESKFRDKLNYNSTNVESVRSLSGNIFGRIRNNDYEISSDGEVHTLIIRDVFVKSQVGTNSIERHFDISVRFNNTDILP